MKKDRDIFETQLGSVAILIAAAVVDDFDEDDDVVGKYFIS